MYADILDIQKFYTNDIHVMAETLGIEAATKAIVRVSTELNHYVPMPLNFFSL